MDIHVPHSHGHRCSHGHPCTRGPREGGLAAAALNNGLVPLLPMDRATVDEWRSLGTDPRSLEADIRTALSCIYYILPNPPVSDLATLCALPSHDGVDRISHLPDVLLHNIVSCLPVKDGARTAALSCRWRGIWFSAPLVLVDAHLLPTGSVTAVSDLQVARANSRFVASAVTRILTAHRGPFRCVRLVSSYMEEFPGLLAHWLQLLAVKGVRELILVNRPWPLAIVLPTTIFGMATLTRLYLALYLFPSTAGLPRALAFPNLRELGLCGIGMDSRDMDFVLARSPVLEILCIQANSVLRRLTVISRSLRCVQMIEAIDLDIAVEDALHLERLIIWTSSARDGLRRRVKIGHAPALSIVGYLNPEWHVVEVGNTVIKTGTTASPSTMVPSVKILGLKVRFGVHSDAQMLPSFLGCFPNIETLHVESNKTIAPTGKLNIKFWQEADAIECVQSHIKLMVFSGFRGERRELSFLKFFLENARMLTKLVIVFNKGSFTSMTEANSKVKPLFAAKTKWASQACSLLLSESAFEEGDDKWLLNFERGSDFSTSDPFACTAALQGCI